MRRCTGVFALLLAAVTAVLAADTDEAAKTRADRLTYKVTVDWKNINLGEAMADLAAKVKDADLGKLEFKYDTDVSRNQKLTYSGKDEPIEKVLDGAFGKAGLGYVVISKKGDKADGGLLIKMGSERGMPAEPGAKTAAKPEKEPKGKTKAEPKPPPEKPKVEPKEKPEEKPKEEPSDEAKEKQAASKLGLIKQLVEAGKIDKAKERLEELVKAFPTTKAAAEAKELLEKLK